MLEGNTKFIFATLVVIIATALTVFKFIGEASFVSVANNALWAFLVAVTAEKGVATYAANKAVKDAQLAHAEVRVMMAEKKEK
jgi:hypothetical protein